MRICQEKSTRQRTNLSSFLSDHEGFDPNDTSLMMLTQEQTVFSQQVESIGIEFKWGQIHVQSPMNDPLTYLS